MVDQESDEILQVFQSLKPPLEKSTVVNSKDVKDALFCKRGNSQAPGWVGLG